MRNSSRMTLLTYSRLSQVVMMLSWIVNTGSSGRSRLIRSQMPVMKMRASRFCIVQADYGQSSLLMLTPD